MDTITHDAAALRYVIERIGAENVLLRTDLPADVATPDPMAALAEAADPDAVRTIAAAPDRPPAPGPDAGRRRGLDGMA